MKFSISNELQTFAGPPETQIPPFTKILHMDANQIGTSRKEEIALRVVVNQRDEYGNTALHLAAWNRGKKIFRFLLDCNADPVSTLSDCHFPVVFCGPVPGYCMASKILLCWYFRQ